MMKMILNLFTGITNVKEVGFILEDGEFNFSAMNSFSLCIVFGAVLIAMAIKKAQDDRQETEDDNEES